MAAGPQFSSTTSSLRAPIRLGHGVRAERDDRAQVCHLNRGAAVSKRIGGAQRMGHRQAQGRDRKVAAGPDNGRPAEQL
jgi:hypothetical protein